MSKMKGEEHMKTEQDKLQEVEKKIEQLKNQKRKILNAQKEKERRERTHRLIERGAILESLIEQADSYSNEEIKTMLEQALSQWRERQKL